MSLRSRLTFQNNFDRTESIVEKLKFHRTKRSSLESIRSNRSVPFEIIPTNSSNSLESARFFHERSLKNAQEMYRLLGHPLSPLAKGGGNREKDRRGKCVFRDVRFTKGGRGFEAAKNEVDRGGGGRG